MPEPAPPPAFTLSELRYALAVDEERHFGRAAAACHVSQPTLSAGVKKLEGTLGVQIFERSNRAVRLTAAGEPVLAEARQILDAANRLTVLCREPQEPISGPLRIGLIPTLGPYVLPWLVPPLLRRHPRLELIPHEDTTDELLEQVRAHRLDAVVLALPIPRAGLTVHSLFDEPFSVLCPREHPLAKKTRIRQDQIGEHRLLLLTDGHCLRDQALAVCRGARSRVLASEGDFRATSLETLRQLVIAGKGITLLPELAISARDMRCGRTRVRPFAAPIPYRRVALAYRRGHPQRDALTLLADFVREHAPEPVRPRRSNRD